MTVKGVKSWTREKANAIRHDDNLAAKPHNSDNMHDSNNVCICTSIGCGSATSSWTRIRIRSGSTCSVNGSRSNYTMNA